MSSYNFSLNERNIIELLRRNEALSKAQLSEMGGMSWATVVKMTNRLIDRHIIAISGTAVNTGKPGKKEQLYSLSKNTLLAIGIDVEYSKTSVILMNFKGETFEEYAEPTPQHPSVSAMQHFLLNCLESFFQRIGTRKNNVIGIGIGLPGIVIPAWLKPDASNNRKALQTILASSTGIPVIVEINARSSTNFLKWNNPYFPNEDFIYISIRTGVGMGMIFRGELFVGHQFISGEIGHFKVSPFPTPCRCGGKGCLETLINQYALYEEYKRTITHKDMSSNPKIEDIIAGVQELFSRAAAGEEKALLIVRRAAIALGQALSYSLMTVYIPNVIISGNFGKDGDVIIPIIESELEKNLLPSMHLNLKYLSIDKVPFAEGDALMAINDYLNH